MGSSLFLTFYYITRFVNMLFSLSVSIYQNHMSREQTLILTVS